MMSTACSFHLRGDYLLPDDVKTISVTSFDDYGMITREVKKQLLMNGVKIVPPAKNVSNLHVLSDSDSDRTLSLYQNARAAEYELSYNTSYIVTVPGYNPKAYSVHVTRSYLDNPMAALAKSVEKDLILDEMRVQAAEQMLRQMATLQTQLIPVGAEDATQPKDFPTNIDDTQPTTQDLDNGVQQTSTTEAIANSEAR
uniref:LPS-assembly lipoprotein LptE n=2 Tax=Vibrionaceae TaxID=641 RepID=A0A5Q0TKF6_9VIBR|nr:MULTISPECIES: LPS assembly lipoprotein LptE [Vibrio]